MPQRKKNKNVFIYLCEDCDELWVSEDPEDGKCEMCNQKVHGHRKLLYVCENCHKSWSSSQYKKYGQNCKKCQTHTLPQTKHDEDMFGKFKCSKCNRMWMSSWAYVGYRQKCTKCKKFILPFYIVPKSNPDVEAENKCDPRKSHKDKLCERCLKGMACIDSYR